jgi:tRNA G18 (ribose-2'-O)-methylase SpoU
MAVERIERTDPRLSRYRGVRDAELLRDRDLFAAEGRLIVRRLIEGRRHRIESLLVNDAALRDLAAPLASLDPAVPVFVCHADAFDDIVGFDLHRGCLALVRRPPPTPVSTLIAGARLLVVVEAVANADNIGGIMRNVAAFDGDGVLLSPTCCDPLYRKAIRTSMGAALQVRFARCGAHEWPAALGRIRVAGFAIIALTPRQPSETLDDFVSRRCELGVGSPSDAAGGRGRSAPLALVCGAEAGGLSPVVEAAADYRVRIPISGLVDSLNVAVAVGIALSRLRSD